MSSSNVSENRASRPLMLALLLSIPASLMAVAASGAGALLGDVTVAQAVQELGIPGAEQLAWFGWVLGGTPGATSVALAVALALYVRRSVLPALLMVSATLVPHANYAIKWLVESPRPTADQVRVTEEASFYGFPSGHVMTAMVVYGLVFFLASALSERRWAQILIQVGAIAAILITSFGRVYSGAHWPSDVGGGYLWGGVALLLTVAAFQAARLRWAATLSTNTATTPNRDRRALGTRTPELT